jgi:hypothetical protein
MDMARRVSLHNVKLPSNLLKEVDTERMGKLNEDEGEFLEFLDSLDLEDLKTAQTKRQDMSDQILQNAVLNCDKEATFEERKTQLRSKALQMVDLKNDHNKRFEELKELTSRGDYGSVLKALQKTLRDTEKKSEEMADRYVAGLSEMNCDAFVADFQEQRTLYWLRKVKAEKMEELLKNMRPTAAPRSPRPAISPATPPYIAPMPGIPQPSRSFPTASIPTPYPHPGHSVPPRHRGSNPAQSMPPYHPRMPQMSMPQPQPQGPPQGHPFPAAAFTGYQPPGVPTGYPPRPPPHPAPYSSYPANAY